MAETCKEIKRDAELELRGKRALASQDDSIHILEGHPCPLTERSSSLALSSWSGEEFQWDQAEPPIRCKMPKWKTFSCSRTADHKHGYRVTLGSCNSQEGHSRLHTLENRTKTRESLSCIYSRLYT